jgi:hypothetical protein
MCDSGTPKVLITDFLSSVTGCASVTAEVSAKLK